MSEHEGNEHPVPGCWMDDDEVEGRDFEYSVRRPGDYVVSRRGHQLNGQNPKQYAGARWGRRVKEHRYYQDLDLHTWLIAAPQEGN